MESVMATMRSRPLHLQYIRTVPGTKWRPSQMVSQYRSLSMTAPKMAGSCWWNRRMALPTWVPTVAPREMASMAWA